MCLSGANVFPYFQQCVADRTGSEKMNRHLKHTEQNCLPVQLTLLVTWRPRRTLAQPYTRALRQR